MIALDLTERAANAVLVDSDWTSDLVRMASLILAWLTAFLLARLYFTGRTGRMNHWAGIGSMTTYVVVGWAQLVALTDGIDGQLTVLNIAVLVAVLLSFVGCYRALDVSLFTKKR